MNIKSISSFVMRLSSLLSNDRHLSKSNLPSKWKKNLCQHMRLVSDNPHHIAISNFKFSCAIMLNNLNDFVVQISFYLLPSAQHPAPPHQHHHSPIESTFPHFGLIDHYIIIKCRILSMSVFYSICLNIN